MAFHRGRNKVLGKQTVYDRLNMRQYNGRWNLDERQKETLNREAVGLVVYTRYVSARFLACLTGD